MNKQEFNIASNSQNEIEAGLSNLSHNPFILDGITYASIEAFWQSLKFEKGSTEWIECIKLFGIESKKYGNKAKSKNTFTYNGIEYITGSEEHQMLMKIALQEQLKQNPDKLKLLLSTGEINLIHKPKKEDGSYYPDSITIPGEIFSRILLELRNEFSIKFKETTYIIKIILNDGSIIYPAYISGDKSKVIEAVDYYSNIYRNNGILETLIDDTLLGSQNIDSWENIKKGIYENESNDKVGRLLKDLDNLGVGVWFIDLMKKDLQIEDNKKLLLAYLDVSGFSEDEKQKIRLALDICIKAHEGQTQKRPQDLEGLDNIPYSNHPIVVALIALRDLKMTAEEIQACLLHDVIEDTKIKKNELKEIFSDEVINMIIDCSRDENETREQFMNRMKRLTGKSKIIKCLDRFHNIIRAFSIKDPKYISRIIIETKEVYLPAFENIKDLEPIKILFFDLLEGLERYLTKIQ